MKFIPLSRGKTALIDDEDYGLISQYKWHCTSPRTGPLYAARNVTIGAKRTIQLMHRLILGDYKAPTIDHISGNGLDNRRSNLRTATVVQNLANQGPNCRNRSGFRGVSWCARTGKWQVTIGYLGKSIFLGRYKDLEEANQAYMSKSRELHGDFARAA